MRYIRAPGRGTLREALDLAQAFAMKSFDRVSPLREFTIVDDLEDGRSAFLQKLHHIHRRHRRHHADAADLRDAA